MVILSFIKMCQAFGNKLRDDYVSAFSAQAAFFIFLSFFPFAMFIITVLNYLPITIDYITLASSEIFPSSVANYILSLLAELNERASGAVLSVTAITVLWSASRGFLAINRGLSSIYKTHEDRAYLVLRFRSFLYTLILAVMLIFMLVIMVFGNQLYSLIVSYFPFLSELALLILSFRTIVTLVLMTAFFLALFLFVPNRRSRFFAELPGALITAGGWLGFSYLYSFYIDNYASSFTVYGNLTTIVICMLWLYFCMNIMFVGAEINTIIANQNIRNAFRAFRLHNTGKRHKKLRRKQNDEISE